MMGYGDTAGFPWIWMVVGVALWATIIVIAFYAVARLGGRQENSPSHSAEEILRRRYAQGEIDATEYEARRSVLRG